jgi:hypothetical protein
LAAGAVDFWACLAKVRLHLIFKRR